METSELLAERGKTHGDYSDDARCAMRLVDVIDGELLNRLDRGQPALTVVQRHSLYMIAFKMARIVTGTAGFKDHWDDIAGYAKLVADRCWTQKEIDEYIPFEGGGALTYGPTKLQNPLLDAIEKACRNAPPFECPDVGQEPPASWQSKVEERRQRVRRIQLDLKTRKMRRSRMRGRRMTDGSVVGKGYY